MITPTYEQILYKINKLSREVREKQILYSNGPLSGEVLCCYVFGIDYTTGDLYYKDDAGEWAAVPGGGGGGLFDAIVDFSVNTDPNDVGTTFNPNTPALETVLYVSTIDFSQWIYYAGAYHSYNSPFWSLRGNTSTTPGTDFIGTTDFKGLMFKVNNVQTGILDIDTNSIGFGSQALLNNAGNLNTAIGYQSFKANTDGIGNIGLGVNTGLVNTTGDYNVAIGYRALDANTTGNQNIAIGYDALRTYTGDLSIAIGSEALSSSTVSGLAIGTNALRYNTGSTNIAVGHNALSNAALSGSYNTALGTSSLAANTTGAANTAIGEQVLIVNTTGQKNVVVGAGAMEASIDGSFNAFIGQDASYQATTGNYNAGIGYEVMNNRSIGNHNSGIGYRAVGVTTSGDYNTGLGSQARASVGTLNNTTAVGALAYVTQADTMTLGSINGINGATTDTKVGIGTTAATERLDVVGNVKFSGALMPNNTAGTSGYLLTSAGAGVVPTWTSPSSLTPTWQQTLTAGSTLTTNNTVTAGTNTFLWNFDGGTIGDLFSIESNSLTSGHLLHLHVNSTGAGAGSQQALHVTMTGANINPGEQTIGIESTNAHTGGGVNVAGYFNATGGASNYALLLQDGTQGAGKVLTSDVSGYASWATPTSSLSISSLTAAVATNSISNNTYNQTWDWDGLRTGTAIKISGGASANSSTGNIKILEVNSHDVTVSNGHTIDALNVTIGNLGGVGATSTKRAGYFEVSGAAGGGGTLTNIAGYFSATSGTVNQAIYVAAGQVNLNPLTATTILGLDSSKNIKSVALSGLTYDGTTLTATGSGNVTKVGTPVNNQVGVWTGDGTIEGDTALTFDTTTDTLATGIVTVTDDAYAAGWNGSTAVPTKNAIYDKIESLSSGGITWTVVSGTSQAAAVNNGYITNNAGLVTVTLPDTAATGSIVRVTGLGAGGWRIAQNASEQIIWNSGGVDGTNETTIGVTGRLDSTDAYDSIELICLVANTTWGVLSSKGNITLT